MILIRKIIILTCCLLSLSTQGQIDSQVLDGVYVQETHKVVNNHNLEFYFKNSMFCVPYNSNNKGSQKIKVDKRPEISHVFLKKAQLEDYVYFNPYESYKKRNSFVLSSEDFTVESELVFPFSIRYYLNVKDINLFPQQVLMQLDSNFYIDKKKYLNPFYFLKHEVSNAEYREFVFWVRDSIARRILANEFPEDFSIPIYNKNKNAVSKEKSVLNWDKEFKYNSTERNDENSYETLLSELFLAGSERFYQRKEIDSRKLIYEYSVKHEDTLLIKKIPIYPDTSCWINDFHSSFIEPMTNMYFWHPAYDQYPVVGVNYHQIMAFLDWKTNRLQKILDKNKIPYVINYSLPTAAEWDMVSTASISDKKTDLYNENYYNLGDNSWITDLSLNGADNYIKTDSTDTIINITSRKDELTYFINKNNTHKGGFIIDGSFFTKKIVPEKKDKKAIFTDLNIDVSGIYYMGGNVSEWLQETYSENWDSIYTKRHQLLSNVKGEDVQLLLQIEQYYNNKNAKNGHLVMGANWYDERYSGKLGINTAGINTKIFVDPSSAHSTLGFRYVLRVKER
jgi:formylglycine-generating enzyme required for sulfatase activity